MLASTEYTMPRRSLRVRCNLELPPPQRIRRRILRDMMRGSYLATLRKEICRWDWLSESRTKTDSGHCWLTTGEVIGGSEPSCHDPKHAPAAPKNSSLSTFPAATRIAFPGR